MTLSDAAFDVVQNTLTKFTMNFAAPVKALTLDDVEVIRLLEAGSAVYEYPQVVRSVKLADNGLSATVEMFDACSFQNNVNYLIKVTGFDDYTMTASAGAPVSMTISSNRDAVSPFVTASTETELFYKLYDAKNVDVTTGAETVLFNVESYSTDGSYYVAGNTIFFNKPGLSATVVAEYQSGRFENSNPVGNVIAKFDFYSVDAVPVTLKGVTDATVTSFGNDKTLSVPMGDPATLRVKVAPSQGDPVEIAVNGAPFLEGHITFEETTPDILTIIKSNMSLRLLQQGVAKVIVNYVTDDVISGNTVKTPVGIVTITITAPRVISTVTVDKPLTTVGTVEGYSTEIVKLTVKDQYGKDVAVNDVTFTGANDAANAVIAGVTHIKGTNQIQLDGDVLKTALGSSNAIQLTYKAKVNNSKEVSFNVMVKNPSASKNYINIETTGGFGNVARTVDSKDAKSVTFTVYSLNNGIKVGTPTVAPYPANITEASRDDYYFRVTKNGEDITNKVVATGTGATINFSTLEAVANGAVSGSAVKYDLGAGNYTFTLYQCIETNAGSKVLVQQQSATGVATCNTGSYSAYVRTAYSVGDITQANIRNCFEVKDTKGNNATALYYVDYNEDATDYVTVKSITFYDEVGDGEYAAYTVNINKSLNK